jgi:hypothetical protein
MADAAVRRAERPDCHDHACARLPDGDRDPRTKKVRYYYRSSANRALILDAAVDALRAMQARLGPYPYTIYKVVQSAGGYGMESPGLTWIPFGVGSANLRYLVAHETPTSGSTASSATTRLASPSLTRPSPTSWRAT